MAAKKKAKRNRNRPRNSGVRYSNEIRERAISMAQTHTVPEIYAQLDGPSQKTIREWLAAEKVSPNAGRQRRYDRKEILKDLRAKVDNPDKSKGKKGKRKAKVPTYTRTQLCEKYGCSSKFLSQLASGEIKP